MGQVDFRSRLADDAPGSEWGGHGRNEPRRRPQNPSAGNQTPHIRPENHIKNSPERGSGTAVAPASAVANCFMLGPNPDDDLTPIADAARRGRLVFCPGLRFGASHQIRAVRDAVDSVGGRTMVSAVHRFVPALQLARAIAGSGEIGQVRSAELRIEIAAPWIWPQPDGDCRLNPYRARLLDLTRFLIDEIDGETVLVSNSDERTKRRLRSHVCGMLVRTVGGAAAAISVSEKTALSKSLWTVTLNGSDGVLTWEIGLASQVRIKRPGKWEKVFHALQPRTGPDRPMPDCCEESTFFTDLYDAYAYQSGHLAACAEHGVSVGPTGCTIADSIRISGLLENGGFATEAAVHRFGGT